MRTFPIIGGTCLGWMVVAVLLAASAGVSSRIAASRPLQAAHRSGEFAANENLLAEISRRPSFAFGFRNFLGDMVWLKAVQVSGAARMAREDYDQLHRLLDTVANFDPRFSVPYLFGGIILGDSPDHAHHALTILDRGRTIHPRDWLFPFYIGYIRYFSMGEPVEGGKALLEAAHIPGSASYLPLLASRMLSEGREPQTALAFLSRMMNEERNPGRRAALERRMREVIVERDIQALEAAVESYRRAKGARPEGLPDLVAAGLIGAVPREPHGGRYVLHPDGTVASDMVRNRLKVFRTK